MENLRIGSLVTPFGIGTTEAVVVSIAEMDADTPRAQIMFADKKLSNVDSDKLHPVINSRQLEAFDLNVTCSFDGARIRVSPPTPEGEAGGLHCVWLNCQGTWDSEGFLLTNHLGGSTN